MKILLPALLLSLTAALPLSALAGPKGDALTGCMTDNTTGKDRKDLARWVFAAMSVHPDIKNLSQPSDAARDDADRTMARLITTLMTERCAKEVREAVQQEGSPAVLGAFRSLGELAMRELMSNPDVGKSLSAYERYLDQAKLQAAMSGK